MADSYTIHHSTGGGGHSDWVPVIVAQTALGSLWKSIRITDKIYMDYKDEVAERGTTVNIPKLGVITVKDKTVDTKYVPDQPEGDKVAIVMNKHKYVDFVVEDVMAMVAAADANEGYQNEGLIKLGKQIETDVLSLYASCSSVIGTAGGGMVDAAIASGEVVDSALMRRVKRFFEDNEVDDEDRFIAVSTEADGELLTCRKFTEQKRPANDMPIERGVSGQIYGTQVIPTPRVIETGTSPKCQNNLAWQRGGLAVVTRPMPVHETGRYGVDQVEVSLGGLGVRVTIGYSQDYGGLRVQLECLYGVGIRRQDSSLHVRS